MIKKRLIKGMHKGKSKSIPIIERFQPEEDTHKGGFGPDHLVKAGSWWVSLYLGDKSEVWKEAESGDLTGSLWPVNLQPVRGPKLGGSAYVFLSPMIQLFQS